MLRLHLLRHPNLRIVFCSIFSKDHKITCLGCTICRCLRLKLIILPIYCLNQLKFFIFIVSEVLTPLVSGLTSSLEFIIRKDTNTSETHSSDVFMSCFTNIREEEGIDRTDYCISQDPNVKTWVLGKCFRTKGGKTKSLGPNTHQMDLKKE